LCVSTLLEAEISAAGTLHSFAAASISICRAVAPAFRTYSCDVRIPREPAVRYSPQIRLRARF
jgi:hypothetical protein